VACRSPVCRRSEEQKDGSSPLSSPGWCAQLSRTHLHDELSSLADDYVNMILSTEMEFGEATRRSSTTLSKCSEVPRDANYAHDKGDFVLEEKRSWQLSLVLRRAAANLLRYVNPTSVDEAVDQHRHAMELAPYGLSSVH
jgi:hypothetical protein